MQNLVKRAMYVTFGGGLHLTLIPVLAVMLSSCESSFRMEGFSRSAKDLGTTLTTFAGEKSTQIKKAVAGAPEEGALLASDNASLPISLRSNI